MPMPERAKPFEKRRSVTKPVTAVRRQDKRTVFFLPSEPRKKTEAGIPALNLRSQMSPHSATVELFSPSTHSQDPGARWHMDGPGEQAAAWALHLHAGWASAKMVIRTRKTWRICERPRAPTCPSMISAPRGFRGRPALPFQPSTGQPGPYQFQPRPRHIPKPGDMPTLAQPAQSLVLTHPSS
ncbi:unnamed protein product [Spirodela intermedia]|uniref:Uncharacterized protein n=1 Tax=Spirodela intermedia TaxID=51605 RepID=A0A7I8IZH8_SPIIN|nr:unnamed protein product [Spirodela intermedia]CAA6663112.1 unnamed protein product [Spirodela intermedia]